MTNSYVCVDLETTGLNPKRDKIIEIGAVKVVEGVVTERFSTFVNPGRKLEERIVELTGIRDENLYDAPVINEVLPGFMEFLEDYPLLGHSVLFDFSFLKKAAVDMKLPFEKKALDSLRIARVYLAELESRSLDKLCEYYEIPHTAHRALQDAEATVTLYQILEKKFYTEENALFVPQPMIFKVKRDQPASKAQKEKLLRLAEQHKIELEWDVEMLTRSEASRLTDQILSQYGIR